MGTEKAEENGHKIIRFSRGKKTNFGKVTNRTAPLKRFVQLFAEENLVRTGETRAEYDKAGDQEQLKLKAEAGFIYRTQVEGDRRNRESGRPSDMLSFDFDYTDREFAESLLNGTALRGIPHIVHTTRRHTPEDPRVRVYIPLDEAVDNETYSALARITCRDLIDPEMKYVDPVSFRPAQMMFLPTVSKDGEYRVHIDLDGDFLPGQAMLDRFEEEVGDWRDLRNLPTVEAEGELRERSKRAENPTEKEGPVGTFCRAYDVQDAIATFLSDVYEEVDEYSAKPRYTYLGGTTRNGAEVQDDGLFLYSHHGSDPVSDQLVNAFDLVRIHKFGQEDEGADLSKPMAQHPSWKAMIEFVGNDKGYRKQLTEEKFAFDDDLNDAFDEAYKKTGGTPLDDDYGEDAGDDESADSDDIDVGELHEIEDLIGDANHLAPVYIPDTEGLPILTAASRLPPEGPMEDWRTELLTFNPSNGALDNTLGNVSAIAMNDKRLFGVIQFNEFSNSMVLRGNLNLKTPGSIPFYVVDETNGDPWQDVYEAEIRAMLQAPNTKASRGWGMNTVSVRDMTDGLKRAAMQYPFHPIREKLISCNNRWRRHREARLDTIFIRYLGVPDTPYHRLVARMWFVAAVARIFEPGHKYDFVPIIEGPQGIGKSTFIEILSMGWFGHVTANINNTQKVMEEMKDYWINELPELSNMRRAEVEEMKAFVTQTHNTVRLAYDRNPTTFKRQQVFVGTTNRDDYLSDTTGNRRFQPLKATVEKIDFDGLKSEIEMVWGEAVEVYREMRAEQPFGTLPLYLTDPEAQREALELQESRRSETQADVFAEELEEFFSTVHENHDPDTGMEIGETYYIHEMTTKDIATKILGMDVSRVPKGVSMDIKTAMEMIDGGWKNVNTSRSIPDPYSGKKHQKTVRLWMRDPYTAAKMDHQLRLSKEKGKDRDEPLI